MLLVICRPDGRADVPFRAVASRLVRGGADQETRGDMFGAGRTRLAAAIALASIDRKKDALLYAQAALHNYENVGQGASPEIVPEVSPARR